MVSEPFLVSIETHFSQQVVEYLYHLRSEILILLDILFVDIPLTVNDPIGQLDRISSNL